MSTRPPFLLTFELFFNLPIELQCEFHLYHLRIVHVDLDIGETVSYCTRCEGGWATTASTMLATPEVFKSEPLGLA
jgi:hypothetical protein